MNLPPMNMFEFVAGTTGPLSAEDLLIGILTSPTLEDGANENSYEAKGNTAFASEEICSITGYFFKSARPTICKNSRMVTKEHSTEATNILYCREQSQTRTTWMVKVCQSISVVADWLSESFSLTLLPWLHSLQAIQQTSVVAIECRPQEENRHHCIELSETRLFIPSYHRHIELSRRMLPGRDCI